MAPFRGSDRNTMLHLVRNAQLYAPQKLGHCHLLIAAGHIAYIGSALPDLDHKLLSSDTDLQGAILIPGLIDAHTHTTGGGGEAGFSTRVPAVPLSQFTRAGVTSVVGLLGTDDLTRSTSSLIAQTYALREEGFSAWCYTGGYHVPVTTLTGSVRSDIVHIDCVIGVGELAISDHRSSQPTFDELIRLAGEAHVAGLMTGKAGVLHLHLGDGERGLELIRRAIDETELPARVFNPTHINRRKALFGEACQLSQQGCTVDLTAFPVEDGADEWSAEEGLIRYLDGGFNPERITISSDGGGCLPKFDEQGQLSHLDYGRPSDLSGTLQQLIARGVPLETALPAFTTNPAKLLRLQSKGQLSKGAAADLVVLDNNYQIQHVMARGKWHIRDGAAEIQGAFESAD